MGEYTPNYKFYKPAIGETDWGDLVNQNFDKIEWLFKRLFIRNTITSMFKENLVLYYTFDEIVNNKVLDLSGKYNHGDNYGATVVKGKYGRALSFDGLDDYVEVSDNPSIQPTNAITVMGWVNLRGFTRHGGIVCRGIGGNGYFLMLAMNDTALRWEVNTDVSGRVYTHSKTKLEYSKWYHFACTYDGSKIEIYINGKLESTYAGEGNIVYPASKNLYLGRSDYGANYLYGVIDETRIYNRALSESEIKLIYELEKELYEE